MSTTTEQMGVIDLLAVKKELNLFRIAHSSIFIRRHETEIKRYMNLDETASSIERYQLTATREKKPVCDIEILEEITKNKKYTQPKPVASSQWSGAYDAE